MLHSVSHAANDLQWIGRMSGLVLVNKNILVDMSRHDNVRLWSRVDVKGMGYTVEPPNVPIWMLPRLVVRDLVTPLLLGSDMQSKLQEGSSHIRWGKRHNHCRRSGNFLNIVLPHNLLGQVTHHLLFPSHDPSRVPAHVLKRRHVSSELVQPPSDMTMLHWTQQAFEVINMFKPPLRSPSTHIRVLPFVILISRPRNHMSEVSYNPSLQTQRDKSISAHKCHTRNYTFTFNLKKEEKKYYHKQAHVTTNGSNMWDGGMIQLLIQLNSSSSFSNKSSPSKWLHLFNRCS